jgi:hypothetical protein
VATYFSLIEIPFALARATTSFAGIDAGIDLTNADLFTLLFFAAILLHYDDSWTASYIRLTLR